MGILEQLFGLKNDEPPDLLRASYVFFDSTNVLVTSSTGCKPLQAPAEPFYRMPLNTTIAEIGDAVATCLDRCKLHVSEKEYKRDLARFFRYVGVGGWKKLGQTYWEISIHLMPNNITSICPLQKSNIGTYVSYKEPLKIAYSADAIGAAILQLIKDMDKSLFIEDTEPSHT